MICRWVYKEKHHYVILYRPIVLCTKVFLVHDVRSRLNRKKARSKESNMKSSIRTQTNQSYLSRSGISLTHMLPVYQKSRATDPAERKRHAEFRPLYIQFSETKIEQNPKTVTPEPLTTKTMQGLLIHATRPDSSPARHSRQMRLRSGAAVRRPPNQEGHRCRRPTDP